MLAPRRILLIAVWAGFIWMLVNFAADAPVSEAFLINLAYVSAWIAASIIIFICVIWIAGRSLRLKPVAVIGLGIFLVLAAAALDVFFVRDLVAHWLSR